MRVRYTYSSRKTRRARDPKNIRKQRKKYPSIIDNIIENSDIVLEILDARFIKDTRNIKIEKEIKKQKKRIIYVLNKSDLVTRKNVNKKNLKKVTPNVFVSCRLRNGIRELRDKIKIEAKQIEKKEKIIIGVIGYPNTGKSSLINLLIGKNSAKTGAEAGFTKGVQKLKLTPEITLLDSPGVIPDEEYSGVKKDLIFKQTKVGARTYSQVKEPELIINSLFQEYPKILQDFYKIKSKNSEEFIEELGRKKGFLKKGSEVNADKTARLIIKDWQEGHIKIL
jgi:ribosome biogenesis GTPase A